jgi:hypothetical protein
MRTLTVDSDIDFSISDFENVCITTFPLCSRTQMAQPIRKFMSGNPRMNQLVKKKKRNLSSPTSFFIPLFLPMVKQDMALELDFL